MTFPAARVGFAVHHARAGETVLMVVPERKLVAQVLTMIDHFRHLPGEQIRRGNGVEGFDTPAGGWIRFVSANYLDATRGARADLVLVDVDVAWTGDLEVALKRCAKRIHVDGEGVQ